ncbi:MAG: hypothetical protein KGK09_02045 [Burkholderiales bacterium]|nr:hypothetical protein [Burkholderiales bacterium]
MTMRDPTASGDDRLDPQRLAGASGPRTLHADAVEKRDPGPSLLEEGLRARGFERIAEPTP